MMTKTKSSTHCPDYGIMHTYETIQEDPYGIVEYCTRCKTTIYINKHPRTQRIDDMAYAKEHERDLLQRNNRRFYYEYNQ